MTETVDLKKQLTELKKKNKELAHQIKDWETKYQELKIYHEGADTTKNPVRHADKRALEEIENGWPNLTRALAVHVKPESYLKLEKALPRPGHGYQGECPETPYNKLLGLIRAELQKLHKEVSAKP